MVLDPHFSELIGLMPDEMRPYLTGLTAAVSYPTSRSDSVYRLVGEWEGDMYLKVLGLHDAGYNSLRDETTRLEWLGGRLPEPRSLGVVRVAATSSCLQSRYLGYRHMRDLVAGVGKGSVRNLLDGYRLQALDRVKLTAYWNRWNSL